MTSQEICRPASHFTIICLSPYSQCSENRKHLHRGEDALPGASQGTAEPVLAHLSLTSRVFSLSEMWAPHVFSYAALSGLSSSALNLRSLPLLGAYLRLHIPSIVPEK